MPLIPHTSTGSFLVLISTHLSLPLLFIKMYNATRKGKDYLASCHARWPRLNAAFGFLSFSNVQVCENHLRAELTAVTLCG